MLDVMAGYGRHALPLADLGIAMTCIDLSKEYCDELEKISRQENLPVNVICEDILAASFKEKSFDAAYCVGNSFSFFPREDMQKFLQKISRSACNGRAVCDPYRKSCGKYFSKFPD